MDLVLGRAAVKSLLARTDDTRVDRQQIAESGVCDDAEVARQIGDVISVAVRARSLPLLCGKVHVAIPALPQMTREEIQKVFPWKIREEKGIERDCAPTSAVTMILDTVMTDEDTGDYIAGSVYEQRLAAKLDIVLGLQQAIWLVEHQDEFPDLMALVGRIYIDCPGLVVVCGSGGRCIPYLGKQDGRFVLDWHWVDDSFDRYGRIAVSGK